jgi:hypothetical protein
MRVPYRIRTTGQVGADPRTKSVGFGGGLGATAR